jgi:hypothetical protein
MQNPLELIDRSLYYPACLNYRDLNGAVLADKLAEATSRDVVTASEIFLAFAGRTRSKPASGEAAAFFGGEDPTAHDR